jgi:thiol-disulfide isomerase/thioredoxin
MPYTPTASVMLAVTFLLFVSLSSSSVIMSVTAFTQPSPLPTTTTAKSPSSSSSSFLPISRQVDVKQTSLSAAASDEDNAVKAAPMVTGEQLEMMLTEWDTPLVVDCYATWCGPCVLMSPEFEGTCFKLH